ncbi:MAG: histidine kinase [Eudoraea sp.]|uniref:sensor histidine kinase n=1 Tax=Eudoraea sp. TaxID=1979955 RepID=UPI003C796C38
MLDKISSGIGWNWKEFLFQLFLNILLFIFYSFDSRQPGIEDHKVLIFLTYALGALVINYLLIPQLYYKKRYISFIISSLAVISLVIFVEEFIIEPIYFANTQRGEFRGVVYSLLDVMPLLIILSGFKFAWDASKKQNELEALQLSANESELQFLKSQINPHFLFNNLNNLYSYAIDNSPKTLTIILELSAVLRYMLYDCKEKYVSLNKEIEHLENFTKLYELQIEERGKVSINVDNKSHGFMIAPLILSVFLENAFKHSTASLSKDIDIRVFLEINEEGKLHFECENSFEISSNTDDMPHGIGLVNVKKRLAILYPKAYKLSIHSESNRYSVVLDMQLNRINQ